MKVIGFGNIKDGKLTLRNGENFKAALGQLHGSVEVHVEKAKSKRSINQNAYYWGVPVELISEHTGYTPEEVHEILKHKFLPKKIEMGGDVLTIGLSSANLSKTDFMAYIAEIQRWAAECLQVVIPDPNQTEFIE